MNPNITARIKSLDLFLCFLCLVVLITRIALQLHSMANPTTVAFSLLVLVILSAVFAGLASAIGISVAATLCYNYFFLPPIGTFFIAAVDNWIALFVFLFTAVLISHLAASTRQNARESELLRSAMTRLNQFGALLLSVPGEEITLSAIAEEAVRKFALEYCSIHVYSKGKWHQFSGTARSDISAQIEESLKRPEDHPTTVLELADEFALGVRYAQIRRGPEPIGLFVVKSKNLPLSVIGAIAYMIGIRLIEILETVS